MDSRFLIIETNFDNYRLKIYFVNLCAINIVRRTLILPVSDQEIVLFLFAFNSFWQQIIFWVLKFLQSWLFSWYIHSTEHNYGWISLFLLTINWFISINCSHNFETLCRVQKFNSIVEREREKQRQQKQEVLCFCCCCAFFLRKIVIKSIMIFFFFFQILRFNSN